MPNKEDILREQTYKEESMEIERRVFYTLDHGKENNLQAHRNSKAIAMIVKTLREKDVLTNDDIDEILFDCIN